MSGFSAAWLALREPADHRSRNRGLLAALASAFAERHEIRVVDLGCGTGSNLCACAPHLPLRQHWRLVDHDPVLLAEAGRRLSAWATPCTSAGDDLRLTSGNRTISVSFVCTDLTAGLNAALGVQFDLATGAALFDLASAEWIQYFADAVVRRKRRRPTWRSPITATCVGHRPIQPTQPLRTRSTRTCAATRDWTVGRTASQRCPGRNLHDIRLCRACRRKRLAARVGRCSPRPRACQGRRGCR